MSDQEELAAVLGELDALLRAAGRGIGLEIAFGCFLADGAGGLVWDEEYVLEAWELSEAEPHEYGIEMLHPADPATLAWFRRAMVVELLDIGAFDEWPDLFTRARAAVASESLRPG